jgi:hypothetical protein
MNGTRSVRVMAMAHAVAAVAVAAYMLTAIWLLRVS